MLNTFPKFAAFIEPQIEKLREALAGEPWSLTRHETPIGWAEALFYQAPDGLGLLCDLYARWILSPEENRSGEEVHFQDALYLIAGRLYFGDAHSSGVVS